jgi:EAL domain-containing protein (putative c-di-GMP-specific phosphodiesterase class I)
VLDRLELKGDLQSALERGALELRYQPIVDLESEDVVGYEALLRWEHPERGPIEPRQFIPLAEETGLIVPIGTWVLEKACADVAALGRSWPRESSPSVSVNLSARQLARPEIVDEVLGALERSGLDPALLTLELTESVMMRDMELSIRRMDALKQLGVQLAVDDFGTGYSSLNYIRRFPVDVLKVDRSFVDGLAVDGEEARLTKAIIGLAEILDLCPIAEGIEDRDQLARLRSLECRFGQGYLFAPALTLEQAEAFALDGPGARRRAA